MPPAPRSAAYFDGWYADQAATSSVAQIMNRHMGFPEDIRAGVVAAEGVAEIARELRLNPGDTLLDLACGRGAYGLLIARDAGARVIGVDFSARAVEEAREQAARLWADEAEFQVGDLTDCGLPDACVDAVLCTDAIQFPAEPGAGYAEIRRVLRPGGRVALTCWEPVDRDDERLSLGLRRVDLAAGLAAEGFTDVQVREKASWRDRERALWEEAAATDPDGDPALGSLHDEAIRALDHFDLIRRVLAVATAPEARTTGAGALTTPPRPTGA
ncbi:MAG TPA: class I SAM-dependent methyltransferase [Trebonia sp.]|nr:class I SAM-dependent methyltransferase [Trebonia sp.]